MPFLKAEWRKLAIANYVIEPDILKPFLPYKTELDLWNGKCYISLVGFMFLNTKVLGFKIPFHSNFEEVNLRFYVKYFDGQVWKRGVVFIKEIVPKSAITFVANTVYKEHYETLAMKHHWEMNYTMNHFSYTWKKNNKWNHLSVETKPTIEKIEAHSEAEFITEHYWGYSQFSQNKTVEYEVRHPKWEHYPVVSHHIEVDFESVYGKTFAFLQELAPDSVFLAEGSDISVESKKIIS